MRHLSTPLLALDHFYATAVMCRDCEHLLSSIFNSSPIINIFDTEIVKMAESSSQQPPAKRARYVQHPCWRSKHTLTDGNRYDFSQSFDVLVGPEKKRFSVPRDILIERSGFFEAARSPRWKQDPSDPTDLSDHDPQEFSSYLEIVYTGKLSYSDDKLAQWYGEGCHQDQYEQVSTARCRREQWLAILYVLADKLQDPLSANIAMDNFLDAHNKARMVLDPSLIRYVYGHTPPESPLRHVVRDTMVYETGMNHLELLKEDELPNMFLLDVMKAYEVTKMANGKQRVMDAYSPGYIRRRTRCHYHQHSDRLPQCT